MLALLVSVSAPLSAAAPEEAVVISDLETAAAYAYLDLETASPELADTILAARNTIIYHSIGLPMATRLKLWTSPLVKCWRRFPPSRSCSPDGTFLWKPRLKRQPTLRPRLRRSSLYRLPEPPQRWRAHKAVLTLPTLGKSLYTYATYLQNSATYNLGYANGSTGKSLGYASQIPLGRISPGGPGYIQCSVRASTYSTPGNARLVIVR